MPAKNSRPATGDEAGNALLVPLNFLADLPRRQLSVAAQSATAIFRAQEAMRKIDQQAAHRAFVHHEEVAERLRGPCDFNELMSIHADLLRFNLQEAAQYWQQITSAAMKVQSEMAGSAGEAMETDGAEPTLDSLQKAFAATLNGGPAATPAH